MRVATWALAMLVAICSQAIAAPKVQTKAPISKTDKDELDRLDKEYSQHQTKQAYLAAVKTARKLYELQLKISGKDAPETQRRKQVLAGALQVAGDYSGSAKLYQEMLETAEKLHGPESQEAYWALTSLTGPYWAQNRYEELEAMNQRLLALTKKLHGENSLDYARQLQTYATLLNTRNEYTAALRYYEQSLKLQESLVKKGDEWQLIGPIQITASIYWQTNDKPKAIALYDRAMKLAETQPNATAMSIGGTIWGVAAQYHWGKRDDLALPLMKKAIDVYDKEIAKLLKDKPDDWSISSMLGMSGYMLRVMGDYAGAEQRMQQAVDRDEKKLGYSGYTFMLADVKRAEGKPKEALALLEKAAAQMAKVAPQSATAYNTTIADVLRELGDYKRAEQLLRDQLAAYEKTYGRRHSIYGMTEMSLAFAYMSAGDVPNAAKVLDDSLEIAEHDLQNVLRTGTDSDHATYFARYGYVLDSAINFNASLAPKNGTASKLALTTLLRRKGRALDAAAAAMSTIRAKLSPDDKKLLDDLASARAQLAALTGAGPSATGDPAEYAKEIAALEDQIQKLEIAVGKKSAAYRAASASIELPAIQKLVPQHARLVEIVNYQPGDVKKSYQYININAQLPPRRYAAYVLGPTGDPVFVDLAPATDIDQAVEKFRKAVSDPDNDRAVELGRALYDLTVAKIKPALGNASELLVAPDGALNVVPFSALVDNKGEFLVKKYTFTYLTSGRDLLRIKLRTKAQGGGVIFADPSFDSSAPAATKQDAPASRGRRSADLASLSWPRLPGTLAEANAVAKEMKGLKELLGADATETAVKHVHGPKILHLATHGFFLKDEDTPAPSNDNAPAVGGAAAPKVDAGENPLLRSGLAFAGANKLVSGEDDGILTALEASGLDLEGTKLVVLSACETGVGKVTNGDGVYGLRRALVIAGAESLVMSLWQVDDTATKELMVGYYKRLAKGESRSSALREIQLELQSNKKYAHPYYWASFLPAGDNSPIKE